jgi:predicted porin
MENDPFKVGLSGNAQNLITTTSRVDNALTFKSPQMSGATVEVIYGLGEAAGNNNAARQFGGAVGYNSGPLNVKLAYHSTNDVTGNDSAQNTLLIGTWNFGPVTANLGLTQNKGSVSATGVFAPLDSHDYLIGFSAPFGASTIIGSYIKKDDRSTANQDAKQWALGYTYSLSERTNLYTSYGKITNDNGASYKVNTAVEPGTGDQAFNFGIRHKF